MAQKLSRIPGRRKSTILVAAASTAAGLSQLMMPGDARGVLVTWANNGTQFSTGTNWIGGIAPANSTTADIGVFQGPQLAQPNLTAARSIGGLDIQSSGWIFSGSRLTLGTGVTGIPHIGTTGDPIGDLTFNNGIAFSDSPIGFSYSLNTAFNGLVEGIGTGTARTVNFNGTGNTTISGGLNIHAVATANVRTFTLGGSGTGTILVNSAITVLAGNTASLRVNHDNGVITLTGVNTYNGGTELAGGVLNINGDTALGVVPGAPSANDIRGTGSSTLQFANGLGNVTLNGNRGVFIGGTTASTTRSLTLDTGDNTVNFSSALTEQNTGTIVVGNFTKQGSGTLVMSSANSLTGTLNFAAGTLMIANSSALGAGLLRWGGGTLASTAPLTVNNTSVMTNLSTIGGAQTITFAGQLQYNGSTDRTERFSQDAGVVTQVNGGMVISSDAPRVFTISGTGEVAFNSAISETTGQAGTLHITNGGTVTFNVANTYTGGTIIDDVDVDLNLGDNGVFGSGGIAWNAGSMRSTGAARTIANPITLGLGDTKLVSGPADFTFNGPVTVAGGGQRGFSVGTGINATFTNVVSDTDGTGLAKSGAGTLILASGNTYTGGTNIRNGFLNVSADSNLGAAAASISFGSSGTLLGTSGTLHMFGPIIGARDVIVFEDGGAIDTNGTPFSTSGTVTGPGALTKQGAGVLIAKHVRTGGLHVNAGIVGITSDGTAAGASNIGSLTIAGGPAAPTATVDLANNDAVFTATPQADVQSYINFARNGNAWNQPGLSSSAAAASIPKNKTLGVLSGTEYNTLYPGGNFNGFTLAATDVAVKFTYYGDVDFNGLVDFDDYSRIDAGFNNNRTGWLNGDVDSNGIVDFDDYSLIDQAFNTQSGTLRRAMSYLDGTDRSDAEMDEPSLQLVIDHLAQFGEQYAAGFLASVPEPTSAMVISGLAAFTLGARRRRSR